MNTVVPLFLAAAALCAPEARAVAESPASPSDPAGRTLARVDRSAELTCFQSYDPWEPETDLRSDVAIVYGVDDTLTSRIDGWKRQGYVAHMMTGAAWGQYEAYIDGRFDGRNHADEGQADGKGDVIWHHPGVPYMVPTPAFTAYLVSLAKQAIDAGAEALHFEEPEFWARAGYSEGFKKMWKAEYGEEWQRPDSSPDAFWRAAKLKYVLYKRTLEQVFREAKAYARSKGREVRCFVPTHSLVSYAQWGIVSPESSLMDLDNCDGYIAQVWTGTARSPNIYRGVFKERTFETAFLEYASMHAITAPTGRRVYFLADPVEDDPNHTWDDYRANYERTVAASLLFPDVRHFEVMPWPNRVMTHPYPAGSYAADPASRITIPPSYASELMTVVNALSEIGLDRGAVKWDCGSSDVAILASDSLMFQRGAPWNDDERFGGYFGMAMPLVKAGIPAKCVMLERTLDTHPFEGVGALLASYESMKPLRPEYNQALADWVKEGGILVYFGDDSDEFLKLREWWNTGPSPSSSPRADLFRRLGLKDDAAPGLHPAGKGLVSWSKSRPQELAASPDGATTVTQLLRAAMESGGKTLQTSDRLLLRRGSYVIGTMLDETASTDTLRLPGRYLDLFTSGLEVRKDPEFRAGEVFFLRDVSAVAEGQLAGSNLRAESVEEIEPGERRILFRGPSTVQEGLARLRLNAAPLSVEAEGEPAGTASFVWDPESRTALLRFPNRPGGTTVILKTAPPAP